MKRLLLSIAAGVVFLVASPASAGYRFDLAGTTWILDSAEKHTVKGFGSTYDSNQDWQLDLDADGTWDLDHQVWGLHTGTWVKKGPAGLKATLDPSTASLRVFRMTLEIEGVSGATSVTPKRFTSKITGKALRDGSLRVVVNDRLTGWAVIEGKRRSGWAKVRTILTGFQAPR
jgi:hypothetical protein